MSTSSDHNIHGHGHHAAKKSIQIKQDDKFFSRLMSKETSMANTSCRVYYGEASVAVPFMWESQPGTPKHPLSETSMNPPLTPPPSYSAATSKSESMQNIKISKPKLFANTIFFPRKTRVKSSSVSSLSSFSSSSSWSPSNSSASSLTNQKVGRPCRRRRCFSGSGIPFGVYDYDGEHESDHESPTSTLSCFSAINHRKQRKCNNGADSGGCYSIGNLKNAFLCIVGHGSSAGQGTSA